MGIRQEALQTDHLFFPAHQGGTGTGERGRTQTGWEVPAIVRGRRRPEGGEAFDIGQWRWRRRGRGIRIGTGTPDLLDEAPGLRGWLHPRVRPEPPDQGLVRGHGGGPIPRPVEEAQEPAGPRLVVAGEGHGPAGPGNGRLGVPVSLGLLRQAPRRRCRPHPDPSPILLEPRLEIRCVGKEESGEELAPMELQRLLVPSLQHGGLEGAQIAPEGGGVEAHLFVAPAHHGVPPQGASESVEGLVQGMAGPVLGGIGPEPPHERVPPHESRLPGQGQAGQEADPLGLGQDRSHLDPLSVAEVQPTEDAKADHGRSSG